MSGIHAGETACRSYDDGGWVGKAVRDGPGPMTPEPAPGRHIVLDGAVNVRDIGGYRNTHGLEVLRGRLLRGDSLSQLTAADTERLGQQGGQHQHAGGADALGLASAAPR